MALSFIKKPASSPAAAAASEPAQAAEVTQKTPAKTSVVAPSVPSWMRTGKDAKAAFQNEEAKAEARKAEAGKMWRYWLEPGTDGQITFLNGNLDEDRMLGIPVWWEHTIRLAGEYETFACTSGKDNSDACPICELGDKPDFVGVMTILDHTPHTIKNGPNKGKIIKNTRKLFVCKRGTIKLLTKYAAKRGGLAGCTFDVSRPDEKNARVGEAFDFVQKFAKASDIAEKWGLKIEDVQPADYSEEFTFRTPEQLIALGVGKAQLNQKGGYKSGTKGNVKDDL